MKREFILSLFIALGAYSINAQSYCRPTECLSNGKWGKAPSQMANFINIVKTTDPATPDTLIKYERPAFKMSGSSAFANDNTYYYLQDEKVFNVTQGDKVEVTVYSGIWTAEQALYLDLDGDGVFEQEMRAFGEAGQKMTESNSSWDKTKYGETWAKDENAYRKELEKKNGSDKVVFHTFKFSIPEDAKIGKTVIRIKSDGDGSGWHDFDACSQIGWAGSLHDFGMNIKGPGIEKPQTPSTIVANSNTQKDGTLKLRLFKNGGGKAIVSWGDGSVDEVSMEADPNGGVEKNANSFKGIEVTHKTTVDNPLIEIWADGLEGLYLSNTNISMVDLSKLSNLKKLVLDKNADLTSVDLTNLTSLQKLDLSNTKSLTSITLPSSMPEMQTLDIFNSGITSLDISMMPNLTYLSCEQNPALKSLKISKENNKALKEIFVYGNGYNACEIDDIYLQLPNYGTYKEKGSESNTRNVEPQVTRTLAVLESGNEANRVDVEHSNTYIPKQKGWKVIDWRNGKHELEGDGSQCLKNEVNEALKASIRVTPNPASSFINIEIPSNLSSIVRIYSVSGETVYDGIVDGNIKIDVSSWAKGTYIVTVLDNNFKVLVK